MSSAVIGSGYHVRLAAPKRRSSKLRLTQRGRVVLTALAATPLVIAALVFALNAGGATATLESGGAFEGGAFEYVTVQSGQSLWALAEGLAPAADPRDVISQLMQLNALESPELFAGQELAIPEQYAD